MTNLLPRPSNFLVFVLLCNCIACCIHAVTNQRTYQSVRLFDQSTCIIAGNQIATVQVNNLSNCAYTCLSYGRNCIAFNIFEATLLGRTCQLYSNVTQYGYNAVNCTAYQAKINSTSIDFTQTAWLILQVKVTNGAVDFHRNWANYTNGFGNPDGLDNYWIGNQLLHALTSPSPGVLRVEIEQSSVWTWAQYWSFSVGSAATNFTLNVSDFTGNAANALMVNSVGWVSNGQPFSTFDYGLSSSCATRAGWWFDACSASNINIQANALWQSGGTPTYNTHFAAPNGYLAPDKRQPFNRCLRFTAHDA